MVWRWARFLNSAGRWAAQVAFRVWNPQRAAMFVSAACPELDLWFGRELGVRLESVDRFESELGFAPGRRQNSQTAGDQARQTTNACRAPSWPFPLPPNNDLKIPPNSNVSTRT